MKFRIALFQVFLILCGCQTNVPNIPVQRNGDETQTDLRNMPRMQSVSVVDMFTAWGITQSKGELRVTTNGGQTWETVITPHRIPLETVYFLDKQQGWIVDSETQVLSTKDGGTTWTTVSQFKTKNDDPSYISSLQMQFIDNQDGWLMETFSVRRTTDGGLTWKKLFEDDETSGSPIFLKLLDDVAGYVCTSNGLIFKTVNQGKTWTKSRVPEAIARHLNFLRSRTAG